MRSYVTDSGVPGLGVLPWGSHVCQLYRTADDLAHCLVPFFATGLANDEKCLWVTADPLPVAAARAALATRVPDVDRHLRSGQLVIRDYATWHGAGSQARGTAVVGRWLAEETIALAQGFKGLRISSNTAFVDASGWRAFMDYEAAADVAFKPRRILAMCSYSLGTCCAEDLGDALQRHPVAIARHRREHWQVVGPDARRFPAGLLGR